MSALKINAAAIDLLARFFNSHKKGLPEWLKNAREAYLRSSVPEDQRQIILNYQRDSQPQYLECIDFVGISGDSIEKKYLEWANPEAAASGLKAGQAEGGQGNGGKAYLRQIFAKGYFISICDGKLSVVSFTDDMKYHLDFVPNEQQGRDSSGDSPVLPGIRTYAAAWLKAFNLPTGHNITIVRGVGPAKPVDMDRLVEDLQQSPQARQTLRTCAVQFYVNRANSRALQIRDPLLHPDFPDPIVIKVPVNLPYNGMDVATAKLPEYPQGELELRVSAKPLHGQALANWNRIDFHGNGVSVIGFKEAPELPLQFGQYASHLYGRCTVPLLVDPKDNYEMQGRGQLNEGLLSNALYRFIGSEADKILGKLAKSLENASAGKKKKNLERLNTKLASWIESKLVNVGGFSETGERDGGGKKERKTREHKAHDPAIVVKVHRDKLDICLGVKSYELRAVAYDAAGKPVPPGKTTWRSNDSSIVAIDPQSGKVEPRSVGVSTILVKTDGGLTSMPMLVQVHAPAEIKVKTSSPAKLGSNRRLPLSVVVVTPSGQTVKNPALEWRTSNKFIATVGQDGIAVGGEIGDAEVTAVAGTIESNQIQIEVEKGAAGKPRGGGKGHPQILLSDQDTCADGRSLKCLPVIDEFTRECLAIDVAGGIRSGRVIEVLPQLVSLHGALQYLRSDNGPEFVARAILRWLQAAHIETAYIDPGKPWQNGTDESFNGKLRDQHLSLQWFRNRVDAKVSIEQWRLHYNEVRPHSSLGYLTPAEFKTKHLAGLVDGGRSPAMPARADMTKNEELLTGPISAILQ